MLCFQYKTQRFGRCTKNKWVKVKKKPNIVIFEGWCVGATAQKNKDLNIPINNLEKQKDPV